MKFSIGDVVLLKDHKKATWYSVLPGTSGKHGGKRWWYYLEPIITVKSEEGNFFDWHYCDKETNYDKYEILSKEDYPEYYI